jgi:hypothetical protein
MQEALYCAVVAAEEALDDYTQTKQVKINLGDVPTF